MSKTYSAGIVTAYGAAKRAGYQGTYEDFCRQQAGYAENAAAVEQAKTDAVNAKNDAVSAKNTAVSAKDDAVIAKDTAVAKASEASTAATNANQSATSAGQSATSASQSATNAETSAANAHGFALDAEQSAQDISASVQQIATNTADISQLQADLGDVNESLQDSFTDLTELSKNVDGNIPLRYSVTTEEANVSVPLIEHFALEKGTEYTFTFRIKSAINTDCYFYIYKDQSTSLLTKTIQSGNVSTTYTYTTSASVPFSDGKINVKVNKANVYCEVEIKPTSEIPTKIDKIVDTKVGALSGLDTTNKNNIVSAVNEINGALGAIDSAVDNLGTELEMYHPDEYSGVTSATANEATTIVDELEFVRNTAYRFTFNIPEAINTSVYIYFKRTLDAESTLFSATISSGATSVVKTYTTSNVYTITAGVIRVVVNKPSIPITVKIELVNAPGLQRIDSIESNINALKNTPLTVMPEYILNNLCYKPLGALKKGYFCLVSDDGRKELATYTLPMCESKNVPLTMAVMSNSEVFTDENNAETYTALVLDAITNHGCSIAQHGGNYWHTWSEATLNEFFDSEKEFFDTLGVTIEGCVIPGHYNSKMIFAVAGGRFGVVRSGFAGHEYPTSNYYDYYTSGARSNLFGLSSYNIVDETLANNKLAIDYAIANKKILIMYLHDNSLSEANKTMIEAVLDYALSSGITMCTLGEIPHLL